MFDWPYKVQYNIWGWSRFGLMKFRIFVSNGKDYKTFWHIVLWEFTFGISFPAFIIRLFEKETV